MPNDPKWRTIAKVAKQSIGDVIAVYVHMMTCASTQPNATERGRTLGWRDEDVATALDIETEQVEAIRLAMEGRVRDGDYLTGWDRRQSIREDEGAPARAKAFREREKAKKEAEEKERKQQGQTQPNATERNVTTEVEVEVEVEEITTTSSPSDDVKKCPIGQIVNLYHELMPFNPQVKVINEARKSAIRQRWREAAKLECDPFGYETRAEGLECWRKYFEICALSDFLTGKIAPQNGKPAFVADIDFLLSPSGFAKTLENKYHREIA